MEKKTVFLLCLGLFLTIFVTTAFAQEADPVYTQVGLWDVPRAKWSDFVKHHEKYEKPVMERLLAEGVLLEWGFDSNALHDPDDYSHSTWMTAKSLSGIEKALSEYYSELGDRTDAVEAEFASMVTKHKDIVMRSHFYGSRSSKLSEGYAVGSFVQVKPGKGDDYRKAWEQSAKPVFDKLVSDGVIVAYVLDSEYFHTTTPGGMWTWFVAEDIAADQKVDAAFDAAWEDRSEAEQNAWETMFRDMTVEGSHRDGFTRIIHYQTK
jgi:hypothetical protein